MHGSKLHMADYILAVFANKHLSGNRKGACQRYPSWTISRYNCRDDLLMDETAGSMKRDLDCILSEDKFLSAYEALGFPGLMKKDNQARTLIQTLKIFGRVTNLTNATGMPITIDELRYDTMTLDLSFHIILMQLVTWVTTCTRIAKAIADTLKSLGQRRQRHSFKLAR
ncbi:hypothetical protein BO83DRAFT_443701 [Aspergillus eucalypticola CBS 122712]|uniref:Uncharacterized protein n=1 Tax=Aspergillus eucalypticola (strain CBS 122712 / IBT 29274) TaxID=1448314 RepID=A0A317VPB8_ASPEC|nr:uncharacterized protein BO83DRAFT_443701 [Aspergillus eucalypticola CBS 122712]PWY74708.1 hypothetical protein BO83DRAFT_443701 [Aspergillus eucalypticola CBS 122712]